jgi:serine/threonine-protein kinase
VIGESCLNRSLITRSPITCHKEMKKAIRDGSAPTPPTVGVSTGGLPLDILQEASTRLGWAALIYSGAFALAYFGSYLFYLWRGASPHVDARLFGPTHAVHTIVALVSIAMGLAMFALSRRVRDRPQLLLDIGLVFEVVGALGISMSTYWAIYPVGGPDLVLDFEGIPWECVWIVIFPVLAPNTPGKTLLASLAAASTGLFTVTLSKTLGYTSPQPPLIQYVGYFLFSTYLCAGIAFVISRVIYSFGRRLNQAREVGSYQLVEALGQGGMGEVWLARHRMLARPAAIKLIRPEALGTDDATRHSALRRFEREAQATATLGSSHTIDVYDFGVTQQGAFYYVMELLEGLSLEALVKRFGPVPAERAIHLLRQVCHSLGEAHERGLVHRDVKPANIFACRLGPDVDFVKVLDFGLVKATEARRPGATELTEEGVATGTPAYMAPEMALGRSAIDGRADLYGLGCVGYWLLTGVRVFQADTPLAVALAHVQERPTPPSRRGELRVPADLERVILACLEKDPDRRPQTAHELVVLLAECDAAQGWTPERARDWWRLHMMESARARAATRLERPVELLTVKG